MSNEAQVRSYILDAFLQSLPDRSSRPLGLGFMSAAEVARVAGEVIAVHGDSAALKWAEQAAMRVLSATPLGPLAEGFFRIFGRSPRSAIRCAPAFYATSVRRGGYLRFEERRDGGRLVFHAAESMLCMPAIRLLLCGYVRGSLRFVDSTGDAVNDGEDGMVVSWGARTSRTTAQRDVQPSQAG